jgi:ribose transport system ATP-binding protein
MGAGRTELLETLFGLHPGSTTGTTFMNSQAIDIASPVHAISYGLALAPEDRKSEGLVLEMTVAENTSLASLAQVERFGLVNKTAERHLVEYFIERFQVKTPSLHQIISNLSGGNQQKVILGKWLATNPKVLLLDEPTRGIDIHAKREIYKLIDELARGGLAVIVVSSELPEILTVSDRIAILCQGRKTAEFSRSDATEEKIMKAALPKTHVI